MQKFNETFDKILSILLNNENNKDLVETYSLERRIIMYNIPHGKHSRGLAVFNTFIKINEGKNPIEENDLELARVLGWSLEFLHASCLILDDIIDQSITRRGQPCWYKQDYVGLNACNHGFIIEQECYRIIRLFFSDKSYYIKILELMHQITLLTTYGQQMDTSSTGRDKVIYFTKVRYNNIAKYKTSYYTFVLPVRLAMYMSYIISEEEHKNVEEILLRIGILFQIQDDFLDCWGDTNIIGKIGTDIEDGKCCWPIVTALSLANETQLRVLKENYGNKDSNCVQSVKDKYKELIIKDLFYAEETQLYGEISQMIEDFKFKSDLNPAIFQSLLDQIYKRQK